MRSRSPAWLDGRSDGRCCQHEPLRLGFEECELSQPLQALQEDFPIQTKLPGRERREQRVHGVFAVTQGEELSGVVVLDAHAPMVQSALELADQALVLFSKKGAPTPNELNGVQFQRGRALLRLGRHGEAVEALSASHAHQPKDPLAAYWYGQALIANGESVRGRALADAAAPELAASRNPLLRAVVKDHPRTNTRAQ